MVTIDNDIKPADLTSSLDRLWALAAGKILSIDGTHQSGAAAPVFTVEGRYTARGWTEWTQGFQFGAAILQFDATDDQRFLELGRKNTISRMATHVSHIGVHDHGFNNVSTYGNLRRLILEGRILRDETDLHLHELALCASGAVQASRWTQLDDQHGYIYSFNGPHSLFSDTVRSLRSLAVAHQLGHVLMGENDRRISLLERLIQHARTTAKFNVFYGEGRDRFDTSGRVAHESIFNVNDGNYRCPSTQQGYSPFSTWTRGLAWIMTGYAEQLEFLKHATDAELEPLGGRENITATMCRAALAACDFYIEQTPVDGVPYWDTGASGLRELGDYLDRPADPFNEHEPVDSSAAAIAAQGLLRLGHFLQGQGDSAAGSKYVQAGLTVLRTLLDEPYLATDPAHQGILLHAVYHWPNGWDHVPQGAQIPYGEACMWGDYHLLEAALYVQRLIRGEPYLTFFGPVTA